MRERYIHAFGAVLAALVVLLTAATAGQSRSPWTSEFSGEFQAVVACYIDEGFSETRYYLRTEEEREYELVFEDEENLPEPGATVSLSGRLIRDTIYVEDFAQLESPESSHTLGEQRMVIALVNFQNDQTQNVTVQQVQTRMFSPTYSVDQYWREASFGKTWATGDVFGWLTLPMDRACNSTMVRNLTIQALDPLVNLTQYNRLIILIPQAGGCSWAGLGTLGPSTFQTSNGPWTTTVSWCRSEYYNNNLYHPRNAIFLTAHEVGHNFGRNHSRARTWANPPRALGPFGCNACDSSVSEYGDQFCTVGGGWRTGHYNAVHKIGMNWLEPGNLVNVTRSGVYEIDPYALHSNDPKVLRIHRGFAPSINRNEYIFAEWRQPIGYDADINYLSGNVYNGILLHYNHGVNTTATWILDMTPGDSELRNARLATGTTWNDLYTHMSITPLGVSGGMMQVDVQIGTPVLPTSMEVITGRVVSGGLPDLFELDGNYLTLGLAPLLSTGLPVMQVELTTNLQGGVPGAMRFELDAKTNVVLWQRLELYNYSTASWNQVDARWSTLSDQYVESNVWSNVGRFVGPDGEMKARISFHQNQPVLFVPYNAFIDQAVWKILR